MDRLPEVLKFSRGKQKNKKETIVGTQQVVKTEQTSIEQAQDLFRRGTDCFGPEEVRVVINEYPTQDRCPSVPVSETMLKHLKTLGGSLLLDNPNSMSILYNKLGNKLGDGKLLYDIGWYRENPFFLTKAPDHWDWRITMKDIVPGTTGNGENYLVQTQLLAEYVKAQVFAGKPLPQKFKLAIEELKDHERALAELMGEDWQKAVEQLAGLILNQTCRETAGQVLWSIALYKVVNEEYLLPNVWTWTKSRSSDGYLVSVGNAGRDGVRVVWFDPRYSRSNLGVRFSCCVEDLV